MFTLAEVKTLDAGSWKGAQFAGTQVPTLDEVLTALEPTHTNLLLELKNPALYPGYETQVAQVLRAHRFIQDHRVFVHSFRCSRGWARGRPTPQPNWRSSPRPSRGA